MRLFRHFSIAILVIAGGAAQAALPPVEEGASQSHSRAGGSKSGGMLEIYNRLQRLQQEVQTLRGELEEQAYTLDNVNQRQRDLYLDLDRRIQRLESGAPRSLVDPSVAPQDGQITDQAGANPTTPNRRSLSGDKAAYEAAFTLLKNGQYKDAAQAFESFVSTYTNSTYIPNALYWQGEARYVTRDFDQAMKLFEQVVQNYAAHAKSKDALLKKGFIHYEKKQWLKAREALERVVAQYPNTSTARLAEQRLLQMRQENH